MASASNPSNPVHLLVEKALTENRVAIFSKSYCPYCKRVKSLFQEKFPNEQVYVVELDDHDNGSAIQQYLYRKTGQQTVPNVFIGGQHIGGNDDTQAAFRSGKLTNLLKA